MVPVLLLVLTPLASPSLPKGSDSVDLPRTVSPGAQDPVQRIRVLTERARRSRDGLSPDDFADLRAACGEARIAVEGSPQRTPEVNLALLDLAGLGWEEFGNHTRTGRQSIESLSEIGVEELERRFGTAERDFGRWLANEVIEGNPREVERRIAAAALLRGRYIDGTLVPLLRMAKDENIDIRTAGQEAIAGWPDPSVHVFFLDLLESGTGGMIALAKHLSLAGDTLGPGALDRLRQACGRFYVSEDWRDAARAKHLVSYLDTERAVPILIEAMAFWERRQRQGNGSKRILYEILDELQRVSGRSMGPEPDAWMSWWQAVLEGRVELPEELEAQGNLVSRPAFFGLRPVSDKVLFIVDRSGSMDSGFGTSGRSRYEEAVAQFTRFLQQSGGETRFSVVLFSDKGSRWRNGLVNATQSNLESASRWLRKNGPEGATQLREGMRKGLKLDQRDRLDIDDIEIDTVIVLCDGATAEGASWVAPWLARNNEEAQLIFHCAEIGASGDGTLEELALLTGGDYVQLQD